MASDLIAHMDDRTNDGVLVAVRRRDGARIDTAVFKLIVTDSFAGALRSNGVNQDSIDVVKNLLDTPSKLQKGAVMPDGRAGSVVIVGDNVAKTALYFLDALGIRQVERPAESASELLGILSAAAPQRRAEIAGLLHRTDATTVGAFLDTVPRLTPAIRNQVIDRCEARRRPIRVLEPTQVRTIRRMFRGGGITVVGLVEDMDKRVSVNRRDDGGWQIRVDLDERPDERFT